MSKPTFLGPLIRKGVGQCELVNARRGAVLASHVESAFDSKARKKGLLGRDSIPADYALIIAPCSAVHTFSMRAPLDLVFVSRDGTVTKTTRGVKPWRVAGSMKAYAVIEAAEGFVDRHKIVAGDVVALREAAGTRTTPAPDAGPAATRTGHTSRKKVTLADVIARKTPLAWFEAVAVVQELCASVTARGPVRDQRVPELSEIALTPDGEVRLLGEGPDAQWLVHRVGAVLLALVPEDQLPVQLRLLALEEVSPVPRFGSIRELSTELEYYERPDRRLIVSRVFERYTEAAAHASAAQPVALPRLEPTAPSKPSGRWWARRRVRSSIALAVLALAAVATAWAWRRPEGQWMRDGAGQASAAAADAARWARQAAGSGISAARQAVGVGKQEAKSPGPGVTFIDPSVRTAPSRPTGAEPLPAQPIQGAAHADAPPGTSPVEISGQTNPGTWEAVSWVPGTVPPVPAVPVADETTIFTSADTRVVPPGLIQPRVAMGERSLGDQAGLPEVELLVSASGEVESVRLVSPWGGARAAMMLSAVKTWRFRPATLNGEPVRFRFRIKLIG